MHTLENNHFQLNALQYFKTHEATPGFVRLDIFHAHYTDSVHFVFCFFFFCRIFFQIFIYIENSFYFSFPLISSNLW